MIEDDGGFMRNETRDDSHLPPLPDCTICEESIEFCECKDCDCEGCQEGREIIAEGRLVDAMMEECVDTYFPLDD